MNRIRVLVVDDSPLIREIIIKILEKDPEFSVVGEAEDGSEAIRLTQNIRPDLIIMDLYMPVMDGFQAIEKIMAYHPTPILVATSALAREGKSISFRALELGALEVIDKPTLSPGPGLSPKETDFLFLAKMLSRVKVVSHVRGKLKRLPSEPPADEYRDADHFKIVAVAASTGGPKALLHILRGLPENLPAAIVVVQHISEGFSSGLASWLDHEAKLKVKEGAKGEELRPGTMYIAPTGFHMLVNSSRRIVFNSDPPLMSHRLRRSRGYPGN
ncbi:MAG: response regulator [Proteobacteria bacterium]|nr:response regulator [Pseudomonadota bacterium]